MLGTYKKKCNLTWRRTWKIKGFCHFDLINIQTASSLFINVSAHSACTQKGLWVKVAHNALPKVCGKMTWDIIWQSFPNKKSQFHTFHPWQLAFVHPIWHSHNAHVFQMPPSSLFLQFCVCLLSKGLSLPSVLSLAAHSSVGEEWRL